MPPKRSTRKTAQPAAAEPSTKKRKITESRSGTRKKAKTIPDEGSSNNSAPSNQPDPAPALGTDAHVPGKAPVPALATRSSQRTGKSQRKDLVLDAQPIGHSTPPTFQPLFDDIPPSEPMLPSPSTLVPTMARKKASVVKMSKAPNKARPPVAVTEDAEDEANGTDESLADEESDDTDAYHPQAQKQNPLQDGDTELIGEVPAATPYHSDEEDVTVNHASSAPPLNTPSKPSRSTQEVPETPMHEDALPHKKLVQNRPRADQLAAIAQASTARAATVPLTQGLEQQGKPGDEAEAEPKLKPKRSKSDNARLQGIGAYPGVDHPILSLSKRQFRLALLENYFPAESQKTKWAVASFESAKQMLPREWEASSGLAFDHNISMLISNVAIEIHGNMKSHAKRLVESMYSLKAPDDIKGTSAKREFVAKHVKSLLTNGLFLKGTWKGKDQKILFTHDCIKTILSHNLFAKKPMPVTQAEVAAHTSPFSITSLTLAYTAIYSAIEEYKTGEPIPLQFKEAQYVAVYQELIETWAAFAAANEARSTAVLATINTAVLSQSGYAVPDSGDEELLPAPSRLGIVISEGDDSS